MAADEAREIYPSREVTRDLMERDPALSEDGARGLVTQFNDLIAEGDAAGRVPGITDRLIEQAQAFDAEQAKRAAQFEAQVDKHFGRTPRQLAPVTWDWVLAQLDTWKDSCVFVLDAYPHMLFPGGKIPDKYMPLSKRFILTTDPREWCK